MALAASIGIITVTLAKSHAHKTTVEKTNSLVMMSGDTLQWKDAPKIFPVPKMIILYGNPEMKGPFTIRIKMLAHTRIMPYSCPTLEQDTIISGSLNINVDTGKGKVTKFKLPAGSFIVFPPKIPRYVWTDTETIIQVTGIGPWRPVELKCCLADLLKR